MQTNYNYAKINFMKYLKLITLTLPLKYLIVVWVLMILPPFKVVVKIDSCSNSGRCRVYFNDGTTDLLLDPYVGQKIIKQ